MERKTFIYEMMFDAKPVLSYPRQVQTSIGTDFLLDVGFRHDLSANHNASQRLRQALPTRDSTGAMVPREACKQLVEQNLALLPLIVTSLSIGRA